MCVHHIRIQAVDVIFFHRMPSWGNYQRLALIFTRCSCQTSCMNWMKVSGTQPSSTFFMSCLVLLSPFFTNWITSNVSDFVFEPAVLGIGTRYRNIPTFGKNTIRKFSRNTSEMKKLVAHDWEDMLQVRSTAWIYAIQKATGRLIIQLVCNPCLWQSAGRTTQQADT